MPYIQLNNVSLSFGEKKVLNSITYSFNDGITVLHGESGAGKTTLLHLISGIYSNYMGNITVDSNAKMEYCMQEDLLFNNLTVFENMLIKCIAVKRAEDINEKDIHRILTMFGIDHLSLNYVKNLSGGERQRLKMAMVTVSNPDIILLDEPTAKLDEDNINIVLSIIEKVWKNKLIIIVSHDKLNFSVPFIELQLQGGFLK